jgi:hypothetical protein
MEYRVIEEQAEPCQGCASSLSYQTSIFDSFSHIICKLIFCFLLFCGSRMFHFLIFFLEGFGIYRYTISVNKIIGLFLWKNCMGFSSFPLSDNWLHERISQFSILPSTISL